MYFNQLKSGFEIPALTFPSLFTILTFMNLSILNDREGLRLRVIEALGRAPVDYLAQFEFMDEQRKSQATWSGGGVLLPLYFCEDRKPGGNHAGHYSFLLNKRSKNVRQPGDLCAPGGGIHPSFDSLIAKVLRFGIWPGIGRQGLLLAKPRGKLFYEKNLLLLVNALRESWEELRLSPFNVEFLGPLLTYRLHHRPWVIFPLVGRVKHAWKPKLSWEVEKIVSIPLQSFFEPANYAVYSLEVPEDLMDKGIPNPWEFPCLIHQEDGEEEILWGATFEIIRTFFQIVFDFSFPVSDPSRVIRRPLISNYFSRG
jgi:8-oxo-dGTP pyrophosphatase MutT (NUDIX family)